MDIRLNKIFKSYEEGHTRHQILSDVSVIIPSSRFSLILGKSGCGKSTILNLIGGLDTPDSGVIHIGENNVTQMNDKERTLLRRRKIGFIFQFFNLIPTLTVLENICIISELDKKPPQKIKQKAMEVLEQVGLSDRENTMPDRLSGGEQQRVAIARALAHDPEIILADEPTGNLDVQIGQQVLELLSHLIKTHKKTLVMVTHSPEAISFADSIYRIQNFKLLPQAN